MPPSFVAIDFETADNGPDSACAIGLVRVRDGQIIERATRLIRPPRQQFLHSGIHGITWRQVQREPTFAELWPQLLPLLDGAEFLAAHNAPFDKRVLKACCEAAGLPMPAQPFQCTVQLARRTWKLPSNTLDAVSRHLRIELNHHEAGSDAEACARIVLHAHAEQPS
jgi:DNA polymerase-3 subunit epsilon